MLNYFIAYGVYLLGALLYFLNVIEKYRRIAEANPNPHINFYFKEFWNKEVINVIRILLLGVATIFLLLPLEGVDLDIKNSSGAVMFTVAAKAAMLPLFLVLGYTGGQGTIALMGKYKETLYEKTGITPSKDN